MYLRLYGGDGQRQGQGCHFIKEKRVGAVISVELKGMKSAVLPTGQGRPGRSAIDHLDGYFCKGKGHFCVSPDRVIGDRAL